MITYRASGEDELDQLVEVALRAFQQHDDALWRGFLTPSPHLRPGDTTVADAGGTVAGHASAMRFTVRLHGTDVSMRGISAVAVAPEFRRRGIADGLLRSILQRLRDEGETWSLLYPFKVPFYRKFGYGVGDTYEVIRSRPADLESSHLREHVRRLDAVRDLPALTLLYEQQLRSGCLHRSDWWWQQRVLARVQDGVVFDCDGVRGYLLYEVPKRPARLGSQHMIAFEWLGTDPDAVRGLFGFLHALGEQYGEIRMRVPPGVGAGLLQDFDTCDLDGKICGHHAVGSMVRIIDLRRALATHPGFTGTGTVGLDVVDPVFEDHTGSWDVSWDNGHVDVQRAQRCPERLHVSIDQLASFLFGATDAVAQWSLGQVGGSRVAAEHVAAMTAGQRPFLFALNSF